MAGEAAAPEAARREVSEETGIPAGKIDVLAYLGKIDYSFPPVPRHELHRKTVHFFLMQARAGQHVADARRGQH